MGLAGIRNAKPDRSTSLLFLPLTSNRFLQGTSHPLLPIPQKFASRLSSFETPAQSKKTKRQITASGFFQGLLKPNHLYIYRMQSSCFTPHRQVGRRARRLRRVIESSPIAPDEDSIEASDIDDGPADVPNPDLDEGISEVPNTMGSLDDEDFDMDEGPVEVLNSMSITDGEDHDDDPQLDVRTQKQFDEEQLPSDDDGDDGDDDNDDDDDEILGTSQTALFSEDSFQKISSELARGQQGALMSSPGAFQHIHDRYRHYLSKLCACSDTRNLDDRMFAVLKVAVATAQKLPLRDDHSSNSYLDRFAHGMVVYVWLSVLLFSSFNWQGLGDVLHIEFGSLLLCAHALLDETNVDWRDIQQAVAYWHRQLKDEEAWLERLKHVHHYPQAYQESDPTANEYLQKYDSNGVAGLGWLVIDQERKEKHHTTSIKDILEDDTRVEAVGAELVAIQVSMGGDLLKAIIQGRMFELSSIRGHPVRKALDSLHRINKQPSIYMNAIADGVGISPAPCHWAEVCEHINLYLEDNTDACDLAEDVDQLISPVQSWPASRSRAGFRRYTDFSPSESQERPKISRHRRQMVRHFVSEMESRIQSEREQGRLYVPFKAPVVEVGYSIDSKKRLREHRNHRSSNYLMNLAEAMFQYLYPDLFPIRQAIIYACYRPMQPWLSEIMFTRIAQGYTYGGRGFSHYPPGFSNGSAYKYTPYKSWEFYLRKTRADIGFQTRLAQLTEETEEKKLKKEEHVQQRLAYLRSFYIFQR